MSLENLDWYSIICHTSAFLSAIALFQYGAETLTYNVAKIARQIGVTETVVTIILTTGAELEEVSIVVATLIQKKASLGLGNIIGSTICNVLGAFSIVVLFHDGRLYFHRGAKIFSSISFLITSLLCFVTWQEGMDIQGGIILLVGFTIYIFTIGSAVYEGIIKPLEILDFHGENFNQQDNESVICEEGSVVDAEQMIRSQLEENTAQHLNINIFPSVVHCGPTETSVLLPSGSIEIDNLPRPVKPYLDPYRSRRRFFYHHITKSLLGMMALLLSGLVSTYSVAALADVFNLSDYFAGLIILSFTAPIPERIIKFSRYRRFRPDVILASTAGTNITLLTLCMGILLSVGDDKRSDDFTKSITGFEIWICWGCSFILLILSWVGGNPFVGGLLIVCYIIYVGCELTIMRR